MSDNSSSNEINEDLGQSSGTNQSEIQDLGQSSGTNQSEIQEMAEELNELNELQQQLQVVVHPQLSDEQCIYKVPQRIRQINPQAYTPQIIAIGPFHHPPEHNPPEHNPPEDIYKNLREMERLKLKYAKAFLDRTNLLWDTLVLNLQELENRIRNCYAEHFTLNSNEFLKIILVDACFIIEHFYRGYHSARFVEINDPILLKPGLLREIERDLLLLENQLPFFVLQEIYNLGNRPAVEDPFIQVTMRYFRNHNLQRLGFQIIHPRHFTDLQRTLFLPTGGYETQNRENVIPGELLYSASQLSDAGLKFQLRNNTCLFNLELDNGVLHMPCFIVSDTIETDMKNLLAFEECHTYNMHTKYISQYLRILDFLINTEKDVNILVDKKIIVHRLGDANEVATLINNLAKTVSLPTFFQRYITMFQGLNGFPEKGCNKNKAICKRDYCSTPFKALSISIAALLVILTLTQTIFSIIPVVPKHHHG